MVGFTAFGSLSDCRVEKGLRRTHRLRRAWMWCWPWGRREAGRSGLAGDQAAEGPDGSARRSGGGGLKRQRRALREENRSSGYPISDSAGVHV